MTNKEYRDHEGVSRSELNLLLKTSPMHLKFAQEQPNNEDSPALLFGRASHKIMLEPESFDTEFACAPSCDRRTKEGKEIFANFLAASYGKDVLTEEDFLKCVDMRRAIESDPVASKFLLGGENEQSFFWTDAETGEPCKVRPDCIKEVDGKKFIVDYKTTDSCADGHFERSVRQYGYKLQAGMYREGVFNNTFEDYGFAFVAQEKKAPYAARVYICSDAFIAEGYELFRKAIDLYHNCKKSGIWGGYEATELVEEGE